MKTIFIFLVLLFTAIGAKAQEKMFVHTATAENSFDFYTYLDNPLTNDSPNVNLIISHLVNGSIVNNKVSGVSYISSEGKWVIFNEDLTPAVEGSEYMVYIASESTSFQHDATGSNTNGNASLIDNPLLNGQDKVTVFTHFDTAEAMIDKNVGVWFDGTNWNLFNEDLTAFQQPSSFFVATEGDVGIEAHHHQVTPDNIVAGGCTILSHASLDNNPNAKLVFSHHWIDSNGIYLNKTMTAFFDATNTDNWMICTEDFSELEGGTIFDILISDGTMGVHDLAQNEKTSVFPNPMFDNVNFTSKNTIEQVNIYNTVGQEVLNSKGSSLSVQLNVQSLPKGIYIAKIKTNKGTESIKLIKK